MPNAVGANTLPTEVMIIAGHCIICRCRCWRIYILAVSMLRDFVNLGPQVAYCLASQESGTKQTASTYQYKAIDHNFDWGVAGGIGFYGMARRAGVFQLELRVHYSFGSLYNNSRVEHFAASNTLTASLNFAYLWQIR